MTNVQINLSALISNINNFDALSTSQLVSALSSTKVAINSITFNECDSECVNITKQTAYEGLLFIESMEEILLMKKFELAARNNKRDVFAHFDLEVLYHKFDKFFDEGILSKNDSVQTYVYNWLEDESMEFLSSHFTFEEIEQLYNACNKEVDICKYLDSIGESL